MQRAHRLHRLLLVLTLLMIIPAGATLAQPNTQSPLTETIEIDLTTLLQVPTQYHGSIQQIMSENTHYLPSTSRFTVSALQHSSEWLYVTLVPSEIVEAGWEIDLAPAAIVELLARRSGPQSWQGAIQGSPDFLTLAADVPQEFADFSYLLTPPRNQAVNYLFPWTNGQEWFKTQGWHQGNALDFQPVVRTNPAAHFAVLAAEAGTLKLICGGQNTSDPYQAHLRIIHADGSTTQYLHLAADAIRYDLINQPVQRGQFLGLLYNGTQGQGGGFQYSTVCGSGQAVHLHFTPSSQTITIDGYSAGSVAGAPFATKYRSSNTRIDSTPTLALNNSSFESGTQGWSLVGPCNYTTYQNNPHHGNSYLAANRNGNPACTSIYQDINIPVQAGQTYRLGAWIRSGSGNNLEGSVVLWGIGQNPNENASAGYSFDGSYWKCIETVFTPTMSHTSFRAEFYLGSMDNEFHIDDTQIRQGNIPFCLRVGEGSSRIDLFQAAYDRNGGHPNLGSPAMVAQWIWADSGAPLVVVQPMETHAYIIHDELKDTPQGSVPAYVLRGPILTHFQALGGSNSWLGVGPTSDQFTNSSGQQQSNFPAGFITWNGTTATTSAWPTPITGQWRAEYHNGTNLDAQPTWVQNEPVISHAWGSQSPGNGQWGVWADNFAVRWQGSFNFAAGTYRFTAHADDQIKVWIDQNLVIDRQLSPGVATISLSAGQHDLRVEMLENGGTAHTSFSWAAMQTAVFVPMVIK